MQESLFSALVLLHPNIKGLFLHLFFLYDSIILIIRRITIPHNMVIIPILGEALLDLMKGGFSPAESGLSVPVMIIGFLAAFVSGCLACKWMLRLVNNGKLVYFAIYCVAMGACAIIYSLVH